MTVTAHISELQKKHEHLATVIESESRLPAVNHLRLTELKREKLRLKDEIARLSKLRH
ncbi:MAG: DUF465 domain-containing protein [Pseudomonadota bacterium]